MPTTKDDITGWFKRGIIEGATHMIVVCDTYDWSDYPVFVMPGEDPREKASEYGKNDKHGLPTLPNGQMQKVMEVYSLSKSTEEQLRERLAFNFD